MYFQGKNIPEKAYVFKNWKPPRREKIWNKDL
jgi:hypothetical protein